MLNLSICLCLNGYIQNTFTSIWEIAVDYFNEDVLRINMLSLVFPIVYIPSCVLSIYISETFGTSACMIIGALFNTACCWLLFVGTAEARGQDAYGVVIFAQIVCAIGTPLLTTTTSRVANDWFPAAERDFAIFFMADFAITLGFGLGSLVPPYIVRSGDDFPRMFFWEAVVSSVVLMGGSCLVFGLLRFADQPPTPPGQDVEASLALSRNRQSKSFLAVLSNTAEDLRFVTSNPNFMLMFASFSLMTGLYWATQTVLGQVMQPCGYSDLDVGEVGLLLQWGGIVSALAGVILLSRFSAHGLWLKGLFLTSFAAAVFVVSNNKPGAIVLVAVSWTLFGMAVNPVLPVSLELAVELCYPVPASSVAALMFSGANSVTVPLTLGLTRMLTWPDSAHCTTVFTPSAALVVGAAFVSTALFLCVRADKKRSAAAAASLDSEGILSTHSDE